MKQILSRVILGAAIFVFVIGIAGCGEEKSTSSPPVTLEGEYSGSYTYIRIDNELDTTVDATLAVVVDLHASVFLMHFSDSPAELAAFCDVSGEYQMNEAAVEVTADSSLSRGVCDRTFGTGGRFDYVLRRESLSLVSEATSHSGDVRTFRTIKRLALKRVH